MSSEVVVVGAGPAGSFSALQAAKLGAQVTVCEEHSEVGIPSHCTGHISLVGIKRFNLNLPKNVFENEIKSVIFYSPLDHQFSVRFASPITCVINRTLFDQHLLNMASEAGVTILNNACVDSFIMEKSSVRGVFVKRKKKLERLLSRVVIDAEGVSSNLLKRAGLFMSNHRMIVNGVQAEVDKINNVGDDTVEVFLSRIFAPGFFGWIVPRRDGTAKIGLATAKGNPRDCLNHFMRHNPIVYQRLKKSHVTSVAYHPISVGGPIRRTFWDGLLIVGDAASQVKPTTGGGVVFGLTCGEIAGKVAAHAIRYKDSSANFLSEYERLWKKEIGFDMMVMKRLRHMLNNLSNKQLDHLIAICSLLRLGESLKDVRDVDFQGTSLVHLAKNPRIWATALYFLTASFL